MSLLSKIFFIIGKKNKKYFFLIIFFSLTALLLEMLSLSLVIPLVSAMQPNGSQSKYIVEIYNNLNFLNLKLIYFLLFLVFFVFVIKLIFFVFFIFFKNNFSYQVLKDISDKLYQKYIYKDYKFFLQKNTSELIRNISTQTEVFVDQVVRATIELFTEIIVIIGVVSVLVVYNYQITFFSFLILFFFIFSFNFFTKKKSKFFANEKIESLKQSLKLINEAIHGNTLIKVLKSENYFLNLFKTYTLKIKNSSKFYETYLELPKFFLEFFAVILIISIFIVINFFNIQVDILTTLSLYAAAGFKLMPVLNRIMTCIHKLRFGKQTLKIFLNEFQYYENMKNKSDTVDAQLFNINNFNESLVCLGMSFSFKDEKNQFKKIFDNVNFQIQKGETVVIIGESGSGKSTLLNLILGFLKPDQGKILFDDIDVSNKKINFNNLIGYVPQNTYLLDATIKKNIAFAVNENEINENKVMSVIERAQLSSFISNLPNGIDTNIGENGTRLSGGQKQRLSIARALYFDPEILIFDEATNSLDSSNEENFFNTIKNNKINKTIIIVTHGKKAFNIADKIYKIENKKLCKLN